MKIRICSARHIKKSFDHAMSSELAFSTLYVDDYRNVTYHPDDMRAAVVFEELTYQSIGRQS